MRGLRTSEQRATVVYVGRAWAGWPRSRWCNPFPSRQDANALERFRRHVAAMRPDTLEPWLAALWEQTRRGELPLGCWCVNATAGDGSPTVCHAQVLADLLRERFAQGEAKA